MVPVFPPYGSSYKFHEFNAQQKRRVMAGFICPVFWLGTWVGVTLSTSAPEPAPHLPRAFTLSPQGLARAKARLQAGDAALLPAWERVRREAAKALRAGPFSVMQKTKLPPSGDKHDYFSLAPYYWPDPNKPDGLPYVNRDGHVNPESKLGTDSKPFDRMVWAVRTLALAYGLTGDETYAQHAAMLLRTWFLDPATRMNPHLDYGQVMPGTNAGRAAGVIELHVLVDAIDAAGLLESSPAWTVDDRKAMTAWCESYLHWLQTGPFGRKEAAAKNNHGTWYDAQVATLALYLGRGNVAREVLQQSAQRRIEAQIEPDGSQPRELARTRSFHYSLLNLRGLCTLASLGEGLGVDLWRYRSADGRSLRKALDYVAPYADANKPWPHPELRLDRFELGPFLRQAIAVYGEEPYRRLLGRLPAGDVADSRAILLWNTR
jgi:hypothetical protein